MSAVDWDALTRTARDAQSQAYAPYSGYHVGAALLAQDGRVFAGCNVENASYGLCVCAERNAIGAALVAGARKFAAIVVATPGDRAGTPCGMCRQVLAEFAPSFPVRCVAEHGEMIDTDVASLLPLAFAGDLLE